MHVIQKWDVYVVYIHFLPGFADISVEDNTLLAPALRHFRAVLEFESLCPSPDALEHE
jgi:hypothetical protein